jgi:hypothetical protein
VDVFTQNLLVTLGLSKHASREAVLAAAPVRRLCSRGGECDCSIKSAACPMATMTSALTVHTQEKVLCQWCRLQIPFRQLRPPDAHRSQCSTHTQSAIGAPYEASLHPKPGDVCPDAAKQASIAHWTIFKPMASHWSALHTHEPPFWCMGPTGPRGAVRRLCGAGAKTEAPRQVRR